MDFLHLFMESREFIAFQKKKSQPYSLLKVVEFFVKVHERFKIFIQLNLLAPEVSQQTVNISFQFVTIVVK